MGTVGGSILGYKAAKDSQKAAKRANKLAREPFDLVKPHYERIYDESQNKFEAGETDSQRALRDSINQAGDRRDGSIDLLQRTVQGDFLNSNPQLNGAIEQALSPIRQRFAGAGRTGSNAEFDTQGRIASDIAYRNFLSERNNQINAIGQLENLGIADQSQQNALINLDDRGLDDYLRRIVGLPQLQSPQQFFGGSTAAGILGGAAAGSQIEQQQGEGLSSFLKLAGGGA